MNASQVHTRFRYDLEMLQACEFIWDTLQAGEGVTMILNKFEVDKYASETYAESGRKLRARILAAAKASAGLFFLVVVLI